MNKTILIGMTALAFTIGACGKKVPPADTLPPVADQGATPPGTEALASIHRACAASVAFDASSSAY